MSLLNSIYIYVYFKYPKVWPTLRYVDWLTLASFLLIPPLIICNAMFIG